MSDFTYLNLPLTSSKKFCFVQGNDGVQLMSLEKAMAPHSSTLAWKIPQAEEPGKLQSMGLL